MVAESVKEVWKNFECMLEQLLQEKQTKIELVLDEISQIRYDKLSEVKLLYDLSIKRLRLARGLQSKIDQKIKERDHNIQLINDELLKLKSNKIQDINLEYECRK